MKTKTLYFILDNLLDTLHNYTEVMDEANLKDYTNLCDGFDTIDLEHENALVDVQAYLELAIILVTGFEDSMSDYDKEEVNDILKQLPKLDALDKFSEGQLVTYKKMAYQIYEIDWDDLSVFIGHNGEDGFWINPKKLK